MGLRIPQRALTWRFSRSSGPGGQHVNTSDTRVELLCRLDEITGPGDVVALVRDRFGAELRVVAASERSQLANRREAMRRLVSRIENSTRTARPRRATKPRRGAVEARLEDKHRRSRLKAERRSATDD
ncbi:MAG: peptide chain release factor-like protein [Acidimicrobiales bacterium]